MYEKLALAIHDGAEVSFWADIDLGGFRMFEQLNTVFPSLTPMRMSAGYVAKYRSSGKERSEDYLERLRSCREEGRYPLFSDAIEEILKWGVTIEQEVFLTE